MAFRITKLPGAPRTYFFAHEGKRVTPTYAADDPPVLANRPPEHAFNDPWLKVKEVPAHEAELWDARAAARAKAEAKEAAPAPSTEPSTEPEPAPKPKPPKTGGKAK